MPMHECFPERYLADESYWPDLFLCPSPLEHGRFPPQRSTYLPVPVEVPWRLRERAEVFCHHAGHGSFRDRNGTRLLLDALPLVKSPVRLILRAQPRAAELLPRLIDDPRVEYRVGTAPYETLWDEGDALVMVERFNGLSLPLQEARAAGLLVIAGDRFPMNTWLPPEGLVPACTFEEARIGPPYLSFSQANYDPRDVAIMIDGWFGRDISGVSRAGRDWAEGMGWARWRDRYLEVLAP